MWKVEENSFENNTWNGNLEMLGKHICNIHFQIPGLNDLKFTVTRKALRSTKETENFGYLT